MDHRFGDSFDFHEQRRSQFTLCRQPEICQILGMTLKRASLGVDDRGPGRRRFRLTFRLDVPNRFVGRTDRDLDRLNPAASSRFRSRSGCIRGVLTACRHAWALMFLVAQAFLSSRICEVVSTNSLVPAPDAYAAVSDSRGGTASWSDAGGSSARRLSGFLDILVVLLSWRARLHPSTSEQIGLPELPILPQTRTN